MSAGVSKGPAVSDRVEVLPGPGTVIRSGRVAIWAGAGVSTALVTFLQRSAHNVGASPRAGRQIVDHIAGILSTHDPEPGAPFVAVGPADGGWVAVLHGPVQLWDGTRWLAPSPTPGWLHAPIAPQPAVSVSAAGSALPHIALDSPYDLVAGMVPGAGFLLVPDGAHALGAPPLQPSTHPDPAPRAAVPGAATLVDLRHVQAPGPFPPQGGPRPEVEGLRCPRGHLNRPGTRQCARCGAPLDDAQHVRGPRPALGVLIADDGTVYRLERDLVVGSDPASDPSVVDGRSGALRIGGPDGTVAPAHAELRLVGWSAHVVDRGSATGTFLALPGQQEWGRLRPFEPALLPPGSHVSFGQRIVTFVGPWSDR